MLGECSVITPPRAPVPAHAVPTGMIAVVQRSGGAAGLARVATRCTTRASHVLLAAATLACAPRPLTKPVPRPLIPSLLCPPAPAHARLLTPRPAAHVRSCAVSFDDYAAILVTGSALRPVAAAMAVPPLRLCWVLHGAGVVAPSLNPLSSWMGVQARRSGRADARLVCPLTRAGSPS